MSVVNDVSGIKKLSRYHLFSAINDDVDFSAHSHDFYEIVIVLEGAFYHNINGNIRCPKKGEIVILRPGDVHSAQPFSEGARKIRDIYVPESLFCDVARALNPKFFEDICSLKNDFPLIFNISSAETDALNERLQFPFFAEESFVNQYSPMELIVKKAIISEILGMYCFKQLHEEKAMPECIIKLMNALQSHEFSELSISEMAYELGYSHNYLCAQFKACFGKTIKRFLTDRKLEKALRLLTDTENSVDKIAGILGWSKTSCFISAFKETYGLTPLQYRKSQKNKKIAEKNK